MGMDFCSILKINVNNPSFNTAISSLEEKSPALVQQVDEYWRKVGFSNISCGSPAWVPRYSVDAGLSTRPSLPNLQISLRTKESFYLTFGVDSVCIYHPLRWNRFINEKEWQCIMVNAINSFAIIFSASDCVITNDESKVVENFHLGKSFDESVSGGETKGFISLSSKNDVVFRVSECDFEWNSSSLFQCEITKNQFTED